MSQDVNPGSETPECILLILAYYCSTEKGVSNFENEEVRGPQLPLELSLKGGQDLPGRQGNRGGRR